MVTTAGATGLRLLGPVRAPRARRLTPALLLSWVFVAGTISGVRAGGAIRAGCESRLASGARVRVSGIAREDLRIGDTRTASTPHRISIEEARLTTGNGLCRMRRVTAFVTVPAGRIRAGDVIAVRGEWLRLRAHVAPGTGLDSPGRTGIVVDACLAGVGTAESATLESGSALRRVRRSIRALAARRLSDRLPVDVDPAARALLLAERDDLAPVLRRRFVDAGLAHLLAISGLHVGIVSGLALALVAPLASARMRYPLAAGVVAVYVAILGAPAPALRASLLFGGWAMSRRAGRPVRGADLLGLSALVFLVTDPPVLFDPGFQLSFAGFAGVTLGPAVFRGTGRSGAWGRKASRGWRGPGRALLTGLLASTGAFLVTAPIAAFHFGRLAPVSVISSLVGSPIVALSIWGLAGSLLPAPLGTTFGTGAAACLRLLQATAGWFAGVQGGHFDAAPPTVDTWIAWMIGLAALGGIARGIRPLRIAVPVAATAALLIGQPLSRLGHRHRPALLCTLAVGQGDAAILRTFRGRWIVFDGGPETGQGAGRETVVSALRMRGARSVALVVLSHPDVDHIGGLSRLLGEFPVGAVLDTGDPLPRAPYARLLGLAEQSGVPWILSGTGGRLRVDGADLLVLGPDEVPADTESWASRGTNESSLIVRVSLAGFRYLNPGDATVAGESAVLGAWPADSLRADLLKVGHHGSRTSTSGAWLSAVRPRLAVISAGRANRYGHPHAEVLDRIAAAEVPRVWRTDRSGTLCVEIRADGRWRIARESGWYTTRHTTLAERHED